MVEVVEGRARTSRLKKDWMDGWEDSMGAVGGRGIEIVGARVGRG